MELAVIENKIVKFIKNNAGNKPVVIGLSGGIDSALACFLLVEALGSNKVHVLIMPTSSNTKQDYDLALQVVDKLKLKYQIIKIDEIVKSYCLASDMFTDKKILGNLKARIRMSLLYGKANAIDGLVMGTGNKTELMTGYFTKYGDGGVDLLPLGDLLKTQVRELAKFMGVPDEIIQRPPTAGLWAGQTDEDEMGISYEELDQILQAIENNYHLDEFNSDQVKRIQEYMIRAKHKQAIAPICFLGGIN